MALVKVYDLDGQEHEKESVDARECVQVLGWSLTPKPAEPAEGGEGGEVTRDKMKAFLAEKGVEFPANIPTAKLAELYATEKAKAE